MSHGPRNTDEPDPDVERLLVAGRPSAGDDFFDALEGRLLGRRRIPSRPRGTVAAGLGLSGALAGVMVVAALAGSGPLAPDGEEPVRAKEDCKTSTVTRTVPEGEVVLKDGTPTVIERDRSVTQTVRDCE